MEPPLSLVQQLYSSVPVGVRSEKSQIYEDFLVLDSVEMFMYINVM